MKLEELRHLLAEAKAPESVSNVRVDLAAGESVGRATLNRRNGEIWERIGVDVVLSDDANPEALQYVRKCACGNMREVIREENLRVHVILPCAMCDKEIKRMKAQIAPEDRLCGDCFHSAGFHLGLTDECCYCKQGEKPCSCERFVLQE